MMLHCFSHFKSFIRVEIFLYPFFSFSFFFLFFYFFFQKKRKRIFEQEERSKPHNKKHTTTKMSGGLARYGLSEGFGMYNTELAEQGHVLLTVAADVGHATRAKNNVDTDRSAYPSIRANNLDKWTKINKHFPVVRMRARASLGSSIFAEQRRTSERASGFFQSFDSISSSGHPLVVDDAGGMDRPTAVDQNHKRKTQMELTAQFVPLGIARTDAAQQGSITVPSIIDGVATIPNTSTEPWKIGQPVAVFAPHPDNPIAPGLLANYGNGQEGKVPFHTVPWEPSWSALENTKFQRSVLLPGPPPITGPATTPFARYDDWKDSFPDTHAYLQCLQQRDLTLLAIGVRLATAANANATSFNQLIAKLGIFGTDFIKPVESERKVLVPSTVDTTRPENQVDPALRNLFLNALYSTDPVAEVDSGTSDEFQQWRKDSLFYGNLAYACADESSRANIIGYALSDTPSGKEGGIYVNLKH
jgi:hypothetical protein